jgi:hypothetical protein
MKTSLLMIDDTEVTEGDLFLHDADFPDSYVHMKHPEDEVVVDGAMEPEFIRHRRAHHHRLLLRVSFRLANGKLLLLLLFAIQELQIRSTCRRSRTNFLPTAVGVLKMKREILTLRFLASVRQQEKRLDRTSLEIS